MSTGRHANEKMRVVKRAVRGKRMSECCKGMSERTSEWPTDPVVTSGFLVDPEYGALHGRGEGNRRKKRKEKDGGRRRKRKV